MQCICNQKKAPSSSYILYENRTQRIDLNYTSSKTGLSKSVIHIHRCACYIYKYVHMCVCARACICMYIHMASDLGEV